jgi:hypothetical protein
LLINSPTGVAFMLVAFLYLSEKMSYKNSIKSRILFSPILKKIGFWKVYFNIPKIFPKYSLNGLQKEVSKISLKASYKYI